MPKKEKKGKKEKNEKKKEKKEKKEKKDTAAKHKHSGGSDSDSSDSSSSAERRKRKSEKKERRSKEKRHKEDRHKEKKKRKRDDEDSSSGSSSSGGAGVQRSVITGRKLKLQRDDKSDAEDARRAAIRAQMNEGETFEWGGGGKDGKPQSAYERRVAELKADPAQIDVLMRKKAEQARHDLAVGFGNKPAGRGGYFPDRGRTV